jgi:hypothetical protein
MTIAWYDPTNHHVSTDKNDLRFTPLGQLLPLDVETTPDFGLQPDMNTEDSEFNRIEMEACVRQMAVRYAMEKTSPIPLITDEEWEALNAKEE